MGKIGFVHDEGKNYYFLVSLIVVDYADMMSAQSLTTWTLCWRSQQLRGHGVSVVNDYENAVSEQSTTMQTQTRLQDTFGKLLKEQSGEEKVFRCLYTPNSNN